MLNAILHGKKRGSGIAGRQLQLGDTSGAEDLLTASVFERLSYLPDLVLAEVLDRLLREAYEFGPLAKIEFWPQWSLDGQCVEPDVVLYDGQKTLLVEAKRHDFTLQQYPEQLARELRAGRQAGVLSEDCCLLVLGGLTAYSPAEEVKLRHEIEQALGCDRLGFKLVCRSWQEVFDSMVGVVAGRYDHGNGLNRLCDDIAGAYAWHGLRTHPPRWLKDIDAKHIQHVCLPKLYVSAPRTALSVAKSSLFNSLADLSPSRITAISDAFNVWSFLS